MMPCEMPPEEELAWVDAEIQKELASIEKYKRLVTTKQERVDRLRTRRARVLLRMKT